MCLELSEIRAGYVNVLNQHHLKIINERRLFCLGLYKRHDSLNDVITNH